MKRPFASLTCQEALHVAIFIEERNAQLYQQFAELFAEFRDSQSLEIASVFWDMTVEERHHSMMLQGWYTERYGTAVCSITEEDIQDFIEVPRLEDGDFFAEPSRIPKSAGERALRVALFAENQARDFYGELAQRTEDAPLRDLYRELSNMEEGHVEYLQQRLKAQAQKDPQTSAN